MTKNLNTARLNDLFNIKEGEDIFGIVGRMATMLEYFKNNRKYKNLIPFLNTYYIVTKAVAVKSIEDKCCFNDIKKLDKLDEYFASLYFKPMLQYLENEEMQKPWQTYLKYCTSKKRFRISFLEMILGINAHINCDLVISLVDLKYNEQSDFLIINRILNEVTTEVLRFLAYNDLDIIGFSGIVFKELVKNEFEKIIVMWRDNAWKNAKKIIQEEPENYKEKLSNETEKIAEKLIDIFTKIDNPYMKFKELHNLKVVLN